MKFLLLILFLFPQGNSGWETLADVSYETRTVDGYEVDFPIFGYEVRKIDGKRISLRGYMVPLENLMGTNYFMLSSLPFNNCFFCGGAGPETIVEVYTEDEVVFTSDMIEVTGIIQLNDNDPDHHMYMMKRAILD